MSTNINGNVEVRGLLSHEYLRVKNANKHKTLTGQKLSSLKNAVTLQKKSAAGDAGAGEVRRLRMMEEESTYILDGVKFSGTEIEAVKRVVQSAISIVPRGNLDYRDYADMGIAQNMVRSYGKEHLTEEQAEVANRAVSDYFDQLIENEPKATETIDGLYYGKRDNGEKIQELRESIRNFIATGNLPASVKQQLLSNMGDGSNSIGSLVISASNQELAGSIRTRFAMMNWENEDEVQSVFEQYRKWMYPAYMEMNGGVSKEAAEATLNYDIAKYKDQYEKIMDVIKAVSVTHIDMQI